MIPWRKGLLLAVCIAFGTTAQSQAQLQFQIGTAGTSLNTNNYPAAEDPKAAIDGSTAGGSKYLNFAKTNTGFIITPTGAPSTVATGINFLTANDGLERDPASYSLYGSNTISLTADPAAGTLFSLSNFTLISSGTLSLSDTRAVAGSISFANTTAYKTYILVFPTVKNAGSANSMQIAEAQITSASGNITPVGSPIGGGQLIPEPGTAALLGLGCVGMLARRRREANR